MKALTALLISTILLPATVFAAPVTSVSKTTSFAWDIPLLPQVISAGNTLILSAPLPDKYSSRKNVLLVTTTVAETCGFDQIFSRVYVNGVQAEPLVNVSECNNNTTYQMVTRSYYVPSEAQGGAAVPDTATVDLYMNSLAGASARTYVSIQVVAAK
jgi:hypothetical protein